MGFLEEIISLIFQIYTQNFQLLCGNLSVVRLIFLPLTFSFSILTLLHLHRYCVGSFLWTQFWRRRFFPTSFNYRKLHRRKSCGMFQASEILHTTSIFFFFDEFHLPGNLLWFACLLFCFVSQCKESLFLDVLRQAGSFRYSLSLLFFIKPSFLMEANQF